MEKPQFVNDNIYHVYNRGVEKRKVFMEERDYLRFIHDLFEFNDTNPVLVSNLRFAIRRPSQADPKHLSQCLEVQPPNIERKPRKLLVEILAFCLMPNHYHLLLRQIKDRGISNFMQKLGTGYTMYFNQKHERVGGLFQGRFKAVLVRREEHLLYLPFYIHLNPVTLMKSARNRREAQGIKKLMKFLESYRWSSYLDYIGKKNFPSLTSRDFLTELVGEPREYKKETEKWLREFDIEPIKDVTLE